MVYSKFFNFYLQENIYNKLKTYIFLINKIIKDFKLNFNITFRDILIYET